MTPEMHNAGKIRLAEELADIFIKYIIKFNSGAWTPYFPDNSTVNFLEFRNGDKIKPYGTQAFMRSVAKAEKIFLQGVPEKGRVGFLRQCYQDEYDGYNTDGKWRIGQLHGFASAMRDTAEKLLKDDNVIKLIPDSITIISKSSYPDKIFKGGKKSNDWGDETPEIQTPLNTTKTSEKYPILTNEEKRYSYHKVLARPNQAKFRAMLLKEYDETCMITGCTTKAALEAAHIKPFADDRDDSLENGLLLRADLHLLFDKKFMAIDPKTGKVHFSKDAGDHYKKYDKIKINTTIVSRETLAARWQEFNKESE